LMEKTGCWALVKKEINKKQERRNGRRMFWK